MAPTYLSAASWAVPIEKAQNSLAFLYWVGDGVEKDKTEAVRWYRKAARQGNDVVIRPSGDDYCQASADSRPNAIENRLTGPLLHAKELVELVDFRPDLFLGL